MASRRASRVFLDTNVVVSGLYSQVGAPASILRLGLAGKVQIVISQLVADEAVAAAADKLPSVLADLHHWLHSGDLEFAPDPSLKAVETIRPPVNWDDAPIVAAALNADVQYFVTGDRRLLAELKGMNLPFAALTPRQFIEGVVQ